jgi:hypothetical protein
MKNLPYQIGRVYYYKPETGKDTAALPGQSLSSLTQAIQSFDDAFLALELVENKLHYQIATSDPLTI